MINRRKIISILCNILLMVFYTACSASPQQAQTDIPSAPAISTEITASATPEELPTSPPEPSPQPTITTTEAPTQPEPTATGVPVEPTQASLRVSEIDLMEQIYIPAGEFIMGTNDKDAQIYIEGNGRAYQEIPAHTVYLDSYWIDKYEVTNGQYALCVAAGVCKPPNLMRSYTREHYFDNPEFANYPVLYIDWYMARAYCEWADRRLPTEAEWEKAARGDDGRRYPWGDDPITGERANFCDKDCPKPHANENYDDGYPDTAPVGSYPAGASPYGVMDMAGNVWEWTGTLIAPYPYDPNDGRENLDVSGERAWRGGPWSNGIWWIRASTRYRSVTTYWYGNLGFRCAASD